ncbi:MAG: hypothetical protein GXP13_07515 [Gammaproteobacteria bacterium]|nr:hypothetical protein [Gammaproteobacteria bacterium]
MNNKNLHSENKGASVTRKTRHVTVAPSPLNTVKLDLGIIIFLSVLVTITVLNYFDDAFMQLMFLSGFGLISTVWIIFRTKRVLASYRAQITGEQNDKETE